jgi:hypothetical protein
MPKSLATEIEEDPVLEALGRLSDVATSSVDQLAELNEDLARLRRSRLQGSSWRHILLDVGPPHTLPLSTKVASDLARAGGGFRRALALGLRREGLQVTEIAALFDVSRQRVSTLIRSPGVSGDDDDSVGVSNTTPEAARTTKGERAAR